MIGGYQNSRVMKLIEIFYDRKYITLDDDENRHCLIVGKTNNTYFEGCISRTFSYKFDELYFRLPWFGYYLGIITPIALGHRVGLGFEQPMWNITANATGWAHTIGLNGIKSWNGTLMGNLTQYYLVNIHRFIFSSGLYIIYEGIQGFYGIKIGLKSAFYMGFARRLKIEEV